jgi:hypothetical protein
VAPADCIKTGIPRQASSAIEPFKLRDEADQQLASDVVMFANTEHEKELILDGVEYLVSQGFPGDSKSKLLDASRKQSF